MGGLYEDVLRLDEANEHSEVLDPLYNATQIDSKLTNLLVSNCRGLGAVKAHFKSQENHEKVASIITLLEENQEEHSKRLSMKVPQP